MTITSVDFRAANNADWTRSFTIITAAGSSVPWAAVAAWAPATLYQSTAPASVVISGGNLYVANPANSPTTWTSASDFGTDSAQWIKIGDATAYNPTYFDLTGYTLKLSLAPIDTSDNGRPLDMNSSDGSSQLSVVGDPRNGAVAINVPASKTRAIPAGDYNYDLLAEKAGSVVRLMFGVITVDLGITNP